jgi:cell division protein FtsL
MIINQVFNWVCSVAVLSVIAYIVFLRRTNNQLKKELIESEMQDEIKVIKNKAYDSSLSDLVDESNKTIGERIKRDKG